MGWCLGVLVDGWVGESVDGWVVLGGVLTQ